MLFIKSMMFMVLVVANQKSFSIKNRYSCTKYLYSDDNNITKKMMTCFVEKDLSVIKNIYKHVGHVRTYLEALSFAHTRLLKVTSEIKSKQQYLGNAMNVFSLMNRISKDWALPLRIIVSLPVSFNPVEHILNSFNEKNLPKGLTLEQAFNLTTGYHGLSRLQDVYHVSTDTLANGKMEGAFTHTVMTADDCFEFAKYYYWEEHNYARALEWFDQTLTRLDINRKGRVTEKAVLELYFLAQCFAGDFAGSRLTYKKLIAKYKKFTPSLRLLKDFEIMAKYGCKKAGKISEGRKKVKIIHKTEKEVDLEDSRDIPFRNLKERDSKLYELCNYPHNVYTGTAKILKCRYIHYNNPAIMIGPIKLEEYHLNPPILLIHNAITDSEAAEIMIKNKPWMRAFNESHDTPHYGATEGVWVRDNRSAVATRLTRRAAMFTGWSPYKVEPFKLESYGVSGQLPLHVDNISEENKLFHPQYADYSTIMFHLNNVDKGGHTIFPALNVTVAPAKGSALIWFNRKPDGSSDQLSLYASCPVLQGSKWTLSKWFHAERQTFPICSKKKNSSFKYFYLHE